MPEETSLTTKESKPPNSAKVWLKRATTKPEDHVTMLPYLADGDESGRYSYWRPAADVDEFEVSADIAAWAIAHGGFVERPGSKTKLKTPPPPVGMEEAKS